MAPPDNCSMCSSLLRRTHFPEARLLWDLSTWKIDIIGNIDGSMVIELLRHQTEAHLRRPDDPWAQIRDVKKGRKEFCKAAGKEIFQ